ncbi:isoprenoid synthase domain-containing protein [Aspergillus avenaceus]|uniref:Isoprenoid synthase domain-containing protein n=1 Tax=Aspergillus avenaceus TaxID=36643 RepID=A0A5N6U160_ASPAV|nr:isoprenoid synthase domain-containing protein [Aspergillus avenaceus]
MRLNIDNDTSYLVDRSSADIEGFCQDYALRRHKYEEKANLGSLQCRLDWAKYIGPIERWGSCNPYEGHFGSVVIPICKPERLAIISYIFEYAFLYDNVVESVAKATLNVHADDIGLDETEYRTVRSVSGTKQIQSKMMLELLSIDASCAQVVFDSWKTMIATTAKQDKTRLFDNLEEYVDYRIIDTGAPFVDTLMRFGMGILLTEDENATVAPIIKTCHAALGLANDYFSFDVEWREFEKQSKKGSMTNAVWLFMQWNNVDIPEAKRLVQKVTNQYEQEYLRRVENFINGEGRDAAKLHTYLKAQGLQIPGNIAWSLRCPRYHPELCDEAASLLENEMKLASPDMKFDRDIADNASDSDTSASEQSTAWSADDNSSKRSSVSSTESIEDQLPKRQPLGTEHLLGPAEYIRSLPSKGVREAFVDALNVWLGLPDRMVTRIKSVAETLHNASLMLDDIEDSSPLRRGRPATHTIFGPDQTINSANYLLVQAMDQVRQLDNMQCMDVFVEEMRNLFIGQSYDLYWTRQGDCPSQEEYLEMISQINLLGQYFQIRDDYKNLSEDYTAQKGFCEDLDEGKYSFPLVHVLTAQPRNFQLRGILQESRRAGSMSLPLKQCVLEHLAQAGSLEYTHATLGKLMKGIMGEMEMLERKTECSNWVLRFLVRRLRV